MKHSAHIQELIKEKLQELLEFARKKVYEEYPDVYCQYEVSMDSVLLKDLEEWVENDN